VISCICYLRAAVPTAAGEIRKCCWEIPKPVNGFVLKLCHIDGKGLSDSPFSTQLIRELRFGGGLLARLFSISDLGQSLSPLRIGLRFGGRLHHSSEKLLDHLAAFDGLTNNAFHVFRFDTAVPNALSSQR